jgi:hypothetical protein
MSGFSFGQQPKPAVTPASASQETKPATSAFGTSGGGVAGSGDFAAVAVSGVFGANEEVGAGGSSPPSFLTSSPFGGSPFSFGQQPKPAVTPASASQETKPATANPPPPDVPNADVAGLVSCEADAGVTAGFGC